MAYDAARARVALAFDALDDVKAGIEEHVERAHVCRGVRNLLVLRIGWVGFHRGRALLARVGNGRAQELGDNTLAAVLATNEEAHNGPDGLFIDGLERARRDQPS